MQAPGGEGKLAKLHDHASTAQPSGIELRRQGPNGRRIGRHRVKMGALCAGRVRHDYRE